MSIFTSIWNLLKKNPATDGNEIFNIETMLNDNWDKIDSALGMKAVNADVRAATITNIALSGLQTVDGVALAAGDRVLVKNQTAGSENGIYVVGSAGWRRASDADSAGKLAAGVFVHVKEGSANAGTGWILTTSGPIELGVTPLTFVQKTGSGSATDAVIGPRTADPNTSVAYGLSGSVTQLFSWVLKYFKAITGKANPFDAPDMTLASAKAHVDATAPHSGHAVIGRKVNTTGGLQGGGDLSADRTISIADGGVSDTHIGTRAIDDTVTATAGADTPTRLWSKLANMIKAITGKANWWTPPVTTIEALNTNKLNTSDYSAADVLAKLKTVDGSGSGLDSDLLEGYHGSSDPNPNMYLLRDGQGSAAAKVFYSYGGNSSTSSTVLASADGNGSYFTSATTGTTVLRNETNTKINFGFKGANGSEPAGLSLVYAAGAPQVYTKYNTLDDGNGNVTLMGSIYFNDGNEHGFIKSNANANHGFYVNDVAAGIYDWKNSRSVLNYDRPNNTLNVTPTLVAQSPIQAVSGIRIDPTGSAAGNWSHPLAFQYVDTSGTVHTNTYLVAQHNGNLVYYKDGLGGVVWNSENHNSSGDPHTQYMKREAIDVSGMDFNNLLGVTGVYRGTNMANSPSGDLGDWWHITTQQHGSDQQWQLQTAVRYFSDQIWMRRRAAGAWQPWVEILSANNGTRKVASVSEFVISTAGTGFYPINLTAPYSGNYEAKVFLRLTSAAKITVQIRYTNLAGTVQDIFLVQAQDMNAGDWTFPVQFFNAKGGQQLLVACSSTLANVAYVSASLVGV